MEDITKEQYHKSMNEAYSLPRITETFARYLTMGHVAMAIIKAEKSGHIRKLEVLELTLSKIV